jgi:hypothetical protein
MTEVRHHIALQASKDHPGAVLMAIIDPDRDELVILKAKWNDYYELNEYEPIKRYRLLEMKDMDE